MNFAGFPITTLVLTMGTRGELMDDGNGGLESPTGGGGLVDKQAITTEGGVDITTEGGQNLDQA